MDYKFIYFILVFFPILTIILTIILLIVKIIINPIHHVIGALELDDDEFKKIDKNNKNFVANWSEKGQNFLHIAVCINSINCIRYLCSFNNLILQQNPDGLTPLHIAAKNKQKDALRIFSLIINEKTWTEALDIKDKNGKTLREYLKEN